MALCQKEKSIKKTPFAFKDRVLSQLTVRNVTDADSGNYTCAPSNAEPTSTMVYVSEGKIQIQSNDL